MRAIYFGGCDVMVPVWLIEADVFGESFGPLKAEIRHHGMVWDILQPRTFLNGLIPHVGGRALAEDECIVFSGSYPLMRHIQLHTRWRPGGWCAAENAVRSKTPPSPAPHHPAR